MSFDLLDQSEIGILTKILEGEFTGKTDPLRISILDELLADSRRDTLEAVRGGMGSGLGSHDAAYGVVSKLSALLSRNDDAPYVSAFFTALLRRIVEPDHAKNLNVWGLRYRILPLLSAFRIETVIAAGRKIEKILRSTELEALKAAADDEKRRRYLRAACTAPTDQLSSLFVFARDLLGTQGETEVNEDTRRMFEDTIRDVGGQLGLTDADWIAAGASNAHGGQATGDRAIVLAIIFEPSPAHKPADVRGLDHTVSISYRRPSMKDFDVPFEDAELSVANVYEEDGLADIRQWLELAIPRTLNRIMEPEIDTTEDVRIEFYLPHYLLMEPVYAYKTQNYLGEGDCIGEEYFVSVRSLDRCKNPTALSKMNARCQSGAFGIEWFSIPPTVDIRRHLQDTPCRERSCFAFEHEVQPEEHVKHILSGISAGMPYGVWVLSRGEPANISVRDRLHPTFGTVDDHQKLALAVKIERRRVESAFRERVAFLSEDPRSYPRMDSVSKVDVAQRIGQVSQQ